MLTKKQVEMFLAANFETGILTWKFHYQRPDLIGQQAGHVNNGYRRLSIDGHEVYSSQVMWLMYYGEWPNFTVDHIDCDKLNDKISNLRKADKAQNSANSKMNCRNTSGFRGVSFCSTTNKWRASIRINGREKNLGRYLHPEEAHEAWKIAAINHFGEEFVRTDG